MIKQGDCLELLKEVPVGSIDAIICDPPYFTGMTHGYGDKPRLLDLNICRPFYQIVFREFNRILNQSRGCLYWFCDWRSLGFYLSLMELEKVPVKNCLVWDKINGAGNFYRYMHEMILFATFNSKFKTIDGDSSNVIRNIQGFSANHKIDGGKIHPAQKLLSLITKLIKDCTYKSDTVLDAFMGSGTTGVACVNTNRRFIGFELDEKFFKIAEQRIEDALAKKRQELF